LIKKISREYNKSIPHRDFVDLIGNALYTDERFFMDYLYPKLYKLLLIRNGQLEQEIMENTTLYPLESINQRFSGTIVIDDMQVKGRIYVTDHRLIAHGKFGETAGSAFASAALYGGSGGENVAFAMALNASIQEHIKRKIQSSMGDQFSRKACFGYQFPIVGTYNVYTKKKYVQYNADIQIPKRNNYKTKQLKIKIKPSSNQISIINYIAQVLRAKPYSQNIRIN
jgi:hypothetical protein